MQSMPRNCTSLSAVLFLTCFVGCSKRPSWSIPSNSFKQTNIQSLVAPKETIRIWFDKDPLLSVNVTGLSTITGQINPSPEDLRSGFGGGAKLKDGRLLNFRCLTQDGTQGTMIFQLDGKSFPENRPFQLTEGRLFLVTTNDNEIKIQQVNREIRDAGNQAELEEVAKSDPKISAFIAAAEKAK